MGFDQYHEPPQELPAATRTFARIIASLTEEAEEINWYEQRLAVEPDAEARAITANAQAEEFKHVGTDLEFLLRRTPVWRAALQAILFRGATSSSTVRKRSGPKDSAEATYAVVGGDCANRTRLSDTSTDALSAALLANRPMVRKPFGGALEHLVVDMVAQNAADVPSEAGAPRPKPSYDIALELDRGWLESSGGSPAKAFDRSNSPSSSQSIEASSSSSVRAST